jgi:hypothetical protein
MDIKVRIYEDPHSFSAVAGEFLRSRPVLHNLILTIVDRRLAESEAGKYWVALRGAEVVGAALQSPLTYPATVVPMEPEVAIAVVDAIADSGNSLPGVNGDAATAAIFAGRWTERRRSAAVPTQGQRLYELGRLNEIATVEGRLRKADARDRSLAVRWLREFDAEAHVPERDIESFIDTALLSQRVWLWDAEGAASMAISSKPVEGVVRLSGVYTPRENRTCGYAAACVHGLSSLLVDAGYRCILYTDLGNPTSNSIYRRIGYKAVSEGICYRFDEL